MICSAPGRRARARMYIEGSYFPNNNKKDRREKEMKRLKKLAALILAVVMVLSMGMTAFAANDASIVINGTKAGQKIEAYRMFTAVKTGTTAEGATVDYTLESVFAEFFTSDEKYGCKDKAGTALSEAAVDYVSGIQRGESEEKVTFAKEVLAWIIKTIKSDANALDTVKKTVTATGNTTTLSNLPYGMYVIYPYGASDTVNVTESTNKEKSPAMIVTVADSTPKSINMKSTYPTVDKEIIPPVQNDDPDYTIEEGSGSIVVDDSWDGDHDMDLESVTDPSKAGDFQVGDEVTFQLTATVPDMTGFTDYTFKFHDTLSNGLDFKNIISVKVGETVLKPSTDYQSGTYTPTVGQNGKELTIELNDFFNQYNDKVGQTITVIYTAVLNENAVVGMDPNTNEAKVVFSNDPTTATTDESETDKVEVHTFDFTIFKYAMKDEGETPLGGAQFELYTDKECTNENQINLVKVNENTWRVATADDKAADLTNTITTPDGGKVQIKGLAAGIYYLKETAAPNGYHKLTAPIKVEIIPTYDQDTDELLSYKVDYTYNGENGTSVSSAIGTSPEVKVENKDGTILPDTGGMGTVIFTVAGITLILGVGASFVISRKKRDAR